MGFPQRGFDGDRFVGWNKCPSIPAPSWRRAVRCGRGIREGGLPALLRGGGFILPSMAIFGAFAPWFGPCFIDDRYDVDDELCGWCTSAGLVARILGSAVDVWWLLGSVRFAPASSSLPVCRSGRTLVFITSCPRRTKSGWLVLSGSGGAPWAHDGGGRKLATRGPTCSFFLCQSCMLELV